MDLYKYGLNTMVFVALLTQYNSRKVISVSANCFVICTSVTSSLVLTAESDQEIKPEEEEPVASGTVSHTRAESL
jgi:hypothetical protein